MENVNFPKKVLEYSNYTCKKFCALINNCYDLPIPIIPAAPRDKQSNRSFSTGSEVRFNARDDLFISSASWREDADAGRCHMPKKINRTLYCKKELGEKFYEITSLTM